MIDLNHVKQDRDKCAWKKMHAMNPFRANITVHGRNWLLMANILSVRSGAHACTAWRKVDRVGDNVLDDIRVYVRTCVTHVRVCAQAQ